MRVLLDEMLPRSLGRLLVGHLVRTVREMEWTSNKNGAPLRLAATQFNVLLTADRNLEHQQNLATLPVAVMVLEAKSNRIEALEPLVPEMLAELAVLEPRKLVRIPKRTEEAP